MTSVRVLIAEDESHVRAALVDLLANDPAIRVVGAAANVEEAIRLSAIHRPDIVIMDVKMPGGGGRAATREIHRFLPDTCVIALSAYRDHITIVDIFGPEPPAT